MNDGSRAFNPPSASQTLINRARQIICSRLSNDFSACLCLQRASLCPGFALLSRKMSPFLSSVQPTCYLCFGDKGRPLHPGVLPAQVSKLSAKMLFCSPLFQGQAGSCTNRQLFTACCAACISRDQAGLQGVSPAPLFLGFCLSVAYRHQTISMLP